MMSKLHVELLTYARDNYARERKLGLCAYLGDAAEIFGAPYQVSQIKNHIKNLLDGCSYLECWLNERFGISDYELYPSHATEYKDTDRVVATRIAWANWLIEEWRDAP